MHAPDVDVRCFSSTGPIIPMLHSLITGNYSGSAPLLRPHSTPPLANLAQADGRKSVHTASLEKTSRGSRNCVLNPLPSFMLSGLVRAPWLCTYLRASEGGSTANLVSGIHRRTYDLVLFSSTGLSHLLLYRYS